jgi:hypothetical protein
MLIGECQCKKWPPFLLKLNAGLTESLEYLVAKAWAIACKVIVLDFTALAAEYFFAIGVVVLSLGVTYYHYLIASKART